jgi:hypothetical protein
VLSRAASTFSRITTLARLRTLEMDQAGEGDEQAEVRAPQPLVGRAGEEHRLGQIQSGDGLPIVCEHHSNPVPVPTSAECADPLPESWVRAHHRQLPLP